MQSGMGSRSDWGTSWLEAVTRVGLSPLFWTLLIFVCLLVTTCGAGLPSIIDESTWGYSSWLWVTHGAPPYVGTVDPKGPGIFLVYAASVRLFGVSYWPPRLLGIVSLLVTSLMLYRFGSRLKDRCAGILAMAVFGLSMSWWVTDGYLPAHTESFMVLFSVLAFLLLASGPAQERFSSLAVRLFLAGASMGLAISFKEIAAADTCALFLIWFFMYRRGTLLLGQRVAGGLALITGWVLTMFLCLLPLFLSGCTLTDYWNGAWAILWWWASSGLIPLTLRIKRFVEVWTESQMILFIPLVALFLGQRTPLRESGLGRAGILLWLLFCFLGVNAAGTCWGHQIRQVMPPLALVTGITLSEMLSRLSAGIKERSPVTALVLVGMLAAIFPYKGIISGTTTLAFPRMLLLRPGAVAQKEMMDRAAWLREHSDSTDLVYVWSRTPAPVLFLAERMSPSRYLNYAFLVILPRAMAQFQEELERRPPRLILVSYSIPSYEAERPVPEWLRRMLEREYRMVYQTDRWSCFERRGGLNRPSEQPKSTTGR